MTQRSSLSDAAPRPVASGDLPSPDLVAFIRYCHRQRGACWPELYDEMCGVAARREFRGWDHAHLAGLGITFSLLEMPRLAGWARAVVASTAEQPDETGTESTQARQRPKAAVA